MWRRMRRVKEAWHDSIDERPHSLSPDELEQLALIKDQIDRDVPQAANAVYLVDLIERLVMTNADRQVLGYTAR